MTGYDFEAIKKHANIRDVISRNVKLTRKGNISKGLCPFHNERTPSFTVYDDNFHCFGCGAHGDVIDFIVQYEGCTYEEAIDRLGAGEYKMTERDRKELTQREKARDQERQEAIRMAVERWESAKPATEDNAYLDRKMVRPHMARVDGKALLIPVYGPDGNMINVQTISADGGKLFQWGPYLKDKNGEYLLDDDGKRMRGAGAPAKGGRLNFGICLGRSIVCEGFATGASIYEAVPDRVAVGFSKSGVIDLVRELHGKGQQVAIASDRNALPEMLKLGKELAIPVYAPAEPYDDFNDMSVAMYERDADEAEVFAAVRAIFDGPPINAADDKPEAPPAEPANDDTDPVDVWGRNEPPELPRGLLPGVIERAAFQAAELSGADPGGYAMAMLAACGAAITDDIKVKVKRSEEWKEEARIWVMLLGEPSYKKSPIMKLATRQIATIDGQMVAQYERDFQDWKEHENGEPPVPSRLRIDDITMEAAQEVARYSPSGVLAIQDELSGWFGGIEKYAGGKGSAKDRSFWLRAFGGGQYAVNRVSRKPFLIENLSISIIGGIQPDAIRKVMGDSTDDGLIQRFFPVVLRPADIGRDDLPNDAIVEYDALIERLHGVKCPENFFGNVVLTFDDEAQDLRAELEVKHHGMVRAMESTNKKMASHLGKYDGIFPRLCVIWHVIENANMDELPKVISYATAKRAARFLHEYIMRHAIAFYMGTIGLSEDQDIIEDVAGYILAHHVETVTMRTFQRGSTRMRKLTRAQVEPICHQLEAMGWLDSLDARGSRLSGKVNPAVHERYAAKAKTEIERRSAIKDEIKRMVSG